MNIIDFIRDCGDKPFDEVGFNEVDGLVFAQLAYLNYEYICTSFKDVVDSKNLNIYETSFLLSQKKYGHKKENRDLLYELLSVNRYRGIKFAHYVNEHNFDSLKQFSAISFIFEEFVIVSYMGTDETLVGWKEDFSMSYMDVVASQKEGVKYLELVASLYDLPIILTGHSKGGNIAIYSACNVSDDIKSRIVKIYSYDSPGFNKKFVDSRGYNEMKDKISVYIPESSFIGLIMYMGEHYNIVASDKMFLYQHNPYNWLVKDYEFILKKKLSRKSLAFLKANRRWIENFKDEERKIFFDTIFDLFENSEIESFLDFKNDWRNKLSKLIKNNKNISNENKLLMIEVIKNMFFTYMKLLFEKKKY